MHGGLSLLDRRGPGAWKRGRLEPGRRAKLDGKASREDEPVPVDSSIETALTFEALRRQTIKDDADGNKDDDDGKP
jgi:hypothetical protein